MPGPHSQEVVVLGFESALPGFKSTLFPFPAGGDGTDLGPPILTLYRLPSQVKS